MLLGMTPTADKLGEFRRIADEIRVRIHLGGMDARDAWAKLEPRVRELEQKLEHTAGRAATEVEKLAAGLRRELEGLHERLFNA
jgi:hypothetical protein